MHARVGGARGRRAWVARAGGVNLGATLGVAMRLDSIGGQLQQLYIEMGHSLRLQCLLYHVFFLRCSHAHLMVCELSDALENRSKVLLHS